MVNVPRVTVQALAAVLGGTQSLHTNSYDEALGLPTPEAATLALRTQQVIAHESGVADFVNPLAGSYVVESLTDDLETEIERLMGEVADRGGAVAAIEEGLPEDRDRAVGVRRSPAAVDAGERVVVGVNRYAAGRGGAVRAAAGRPGDRGGAGRRGWPTLRADRDGGRRWRPRWRHVRAAAAGTANVLVPLRQALAARSHGG